MYCANDHGAVPRPPARIAAAVVPLERYMKLPIIAAMVLTYTLLAAAWLCYSEMSPL